MKEDWAKEKGIVYRVVQSSLKSRLSSPIPLEFELAKKLKNLRIGEDWTIEDYVSLAP